MFVSTAPTKKKPAPGDRELPPEETILWRQWSQRHSGHEELSNHLKTFFLRITEKERLGPSIRHYYMLQNIKLKHLAISSSLLNTQSSIPHQEKDLIRVNIRYLAASQYLIASKELWKLLEITNSKLGLDILLTTYWLVRTVWEVLGIYNWSWRLGFWLLLPGTSCS